MAHQVLKPPWIIIVLQQDSCYRARLLLHSLAMGQLSTAALLRVLVLPHLGRTGLCPVCGQPAGACGFAATSTWAVSPACARL